MLECACHEDKHLLGKRDGWTSCPYRTYRRCDFVRYNKDDGATVRKNLAREGQT